MMTNLSYAEIERVIGYTFRDKALLLQCLTHSSCGETYSYDRLEFLGDRVLGLVIAEFLFENNKSYASGKLTKELIQYVSENALYSAATRLNLVNYIILGKGQEPTKSIVSDVYEALVGAIYIDGGKELAKSFILNTTKQTLSDTDFISFVQEYAQSKKLSFSYQTQADKTFGFSAKIIIDNVCVAQGNGSTKQQACAQAAKKFYLKLKEQRV